MQSAVHSAMPQSLPLPGRLLGVPLGAIPAVSGRALGARG